ncbi:MAG: hypothetical protein GY906_05290 [bacterium]|nr:hypothetical protein [bacterium]
MSRFRDCTYRMTSIDASTLDGHRLRHPASTPALVSVCVFPPLRRSAHDIEIAMAIVILIVIEFGVAV